MAKQCLHEKDGIRCKANVWSHGRCKIHAYERTDSQFLKQKEAKKSAPTKRKRIPLMSKVRQDKLTALHELDRVFYERVWFDRIHVCYYCGKYLGEDLNIMYMHHPLLKSKYPELRHNEHNLDLACFYCHNEAHSANPGEKHLQRKIDLIKYFKEIGLL